MPPFQKLKGYVLNIQWNQNSEAGDLIEHTGLFFHKVVYTAYDV
jgi:hypothetical protein